MAYPIYKWISSMRGSMVIRRCLFLLLMGGLLISCTACEAENVEYYKEPALAPADSAALKGVWGNYVAAMDGLPAENAEVQSNVTGNSVKVAQAPMICSLCKITHTAMAQAGPLTWFFGKPVLKHRIPFRCDAGHVYTFSWTNNLTALGFQVKDENTGQVMQLYDEEDEPQAEEL